MSIKRPSIEVERRDAKDLPYEIFLRDYVQKNKPIVIENSIEGWSAMTKWTPDYFKTKYGDRLVDVSYSERMTFSDFIDGVMASTVEKPGPYMFRFFICSHMPELLGDLEEHNPYNFPRRFASSLMPKNWRRPDGFLKLLIGGVGGKFPIMHFDGDNAHAAITEIYGDKEFILYAPDETANLYPRADRPNQTQITDLDNPDLEKFPLYANAKRFKTVLKPGDTVFVPAQWWHTARVLTPSISVCTNQLDSANWQGFVDDNCRPNTYEPSFKTLLRRISLTALGLVLSTVEKLNIHSWSPKKSPVPRNWKRNHWPMKEGNY